MDLSQHYESYRSAIKKDMPDGAIELAKTLRTADEAKFPTVYDFLSSSTMVIKKAAAAGEATIYKQWLKGHQEAMIGLLERFIEMLQLKGLDLIEKHGWRAFRFSKEPVLMHGDKPQVWIPRHPTTIEDVCFDAEEMEFLTSQKNQELAKSVYAYKAQGGKTKLLPTGYQMDLADINTTTVEDWTLRLFP